MIFRPYDFKLKPPYSGDRKHGHLLRTLYSKILESKAGNKKSMSFINSKFKLRTWTSRRRRPLKDGRPKGGYRQIFFQN